MPVDPPLDPETLARAAQDLGRLPRGDQQIAARVVGDVLLAQAGLRSTVVAHPVIDARMQAHGATEATAAIDGVRPLVALRQGPRDERERALISVLMARHVGTLLERDEADAVIPALDWLEFSGPYAPWTAARVALTDEARARLDRAAAHAPIDAPSPAAVLAVRALRGLDERTDATVRDLPFRAAGDTALISVAGELVGSYRGVVQRALGVVTGWSAVRGTVLLLARHVFSLRRPVTVSLDGDVLRVVGHTELLGRTLRTHDVRYPVGELVEVARSERFPALPAAVAVVALGVGAFFGARAVVEGAGMVYFPLIGIGLALIVGGLAFDLLVRALFPGVHGEARLRVRARDVRAVELSSLPLGELDRLLDALGTRVSGRAGPSAAHPAAAPRSRAPSTP